MPRNALTPDALLMMDTVARTGSFAAAARELGKVPSALTYSVRQLEEALDVLLFDRSSRQAQLTPAGHELLQEGRRLLQEMDAVANRVRRVASGWETELSICVDDIVSMTTLFELMQAFCSARDPDETARTGHGAQAPATRLRLRTEVLAGTWEALVNGHVDLAIGVSGDLPNPGGIEVAPLGELRVVYCMAPHHPLAQASEPLADDQIVHHRAVAVADTAQRMAPITVNLLPGQDVLTLPSLRAKLEALLRGMGCGYLPLPLVQSHLEAGHLVQKATARSPSHVRMHYAWRAEGRAIGLGKGLRWWLQQLESPATRHALLHRQGGIRL